jgi:4-amino-4-deoxy-L-arabinose transferase-like glycosyltransferase
MGSSAMWRWRVLTLLLILAAAALRIGYLAADCPIDLAPDEAHYWDWSRHPDWSYYSKGPLVAYLIRGSGLVFGGLSRFLTGSEMLAVRFPAVLCGSLLLVAVFVLTVQTHRREALAFAVVAVALTLPPLAAGSTIMTIDAPYICLWAWTLVLAWRAVARDGLAAWLATGLLIGLGILAKYTMVLFIPSLGLFLLTSPEYRRQLVRRGFWMMTLTAALCCVPILIWNATHDWVSFRHVNSLAATNRPGWHWNGPFVYVGVQVALLLGWWFVAWVNALVAHRPWREPDPGKCFLWWLSLPTFVVFLMFSVKTGGGEPNWPVTAYISGLVLAAGWLAEQVRSPRPWYRRLAIAAVTTACGTGLAVTLLGHFSHRAYPLLTKVVGEPADERPAPLRRLDPTCRLRGWRTLAAEVQRLRHSLRNLEGTDPVLAAGSWSLPGELAFYLPDQPTVYSLGPLLGDRRSQYDLWRPNPVADPESFAGRTFLVVNAGADIGGLFDAVEPPRLVLHHEAGYPVARWTITVARRYRGVPASLATQPIHY